LLRPSRDSQDATAQYRNDTDDVPPRRHPPNLRSRFPRSATPAVTQREHRQQTNFTFCRRQMLAALPQL
jgi:hypothetical protein